MSNKFDSYVIREATPGDRLALERLAGLDSARPLEGRVLIGEAGDEVRAAVAIDSGRAIADPFHHTGELRALLETRASQIRGAGRRRVRIAMRTAPAPALGPRAAA